MSTFLVLGSVQAIAYLHFNFSGGLRRLLDFFHASLGIPNENAASSPPSAEAHRSDVTIQYLNGLSALFVTWVANGFMVRWCFPVSLVNSSDPHGTSVAVPVLHHMVKGGLGTPDPPFSTLHGNHWSVSRFVESVKTQTVLTDFF